MFKNKFIICITVNGDIVREEKQNVFLPYGTDFNLYFKNLNTDLVKVLKYEWDGVEGSYTQDIPPGEVKETINYSFHFDKDTLFSVYFQNASNNGSVEKISFNLKGVGEEEQIASVCTIKSKKVCTSCGKKFKSSFNYCPYDGTFLNAE